MFTNEDYERLLVKYTTQGVPAGESIQHFCDRMKVPYNLFNKWYRDTRHKIVKIQVDGKPSPVEAGPDMGSESIMDSLIGEAAARAKKTEKTASKEKTIPNEALQSENGPFIMIDLRTTQGLQIRRRGMTYSQFLELAKNLAALC